jgi:putative membrane protein
VIVSQGLDIRRLMRHVGGELIVLLAYDLAVTFSYMLGHLNWVSIPELPLPLLGSAIVLITALRNNAAYARWWEGRTLWGAVVNNSRSFARGLIAMLADEAERTALVRAQIAYVRALRLHLLRRPIAAEIAPLLDEATLARVTAAANVPAALQMAIAARLAAAAQARDIDPVRLGALDATLSQLANAQGGLERIKNTPLPPHYTQLPQLFTIIYCLLLPLGLVFNLEFVTPVGSTVIGFMFLALDRIGRDLEDPFDGTVHDVPMEAIARTIEIDLLQTIGVAAVPPPIAVKDGVLP